MVLRPSRTIVSLLRNIILLVVALASPMLGSAQSQNQQVLAKIREVEKKLTALHIAPEKSKDEVESLGTARGALQSGYLNASLYFLQPAWVNVTSTQYFREHKNVNNNSGLEAFDQEWQAAGSHFTAAEKALAAAPLNTLPAAVRALVQSAQMQGKTYYQAARFYGRDASVENGMLYIGLGKGYVDFAVACSGLKFPKASAQGEDSQPNPEPLIADFEKEVVKSYQAPEATTEHQYAFNDVNSGIKLATELNRAQELDAALFAYLEARMNFGLVNAGEVKPAALALLQQKQRTFRQRLTSGAGDTSLGKLYLEIAGYGLRPNADSDAQSKSSVILNTVLPRYFEAFNSRGQKLATSSQPQEKSKQVTVTLVRWPYT